MCTAQVNLVNNTGLISISGSELPSNYILVQFHFHWGSDDTVGAEHTINGHAYAMEVRILTLSPPIPLRLYTLPYWSNPLFLIFDIRALWRSGLSARAPECQKLKIVG